MATIAPVPACPSHASISPTANAQDDTAKHHENPALPTWPRLKNQDDESGKNEELRQLCLRPYGHDCEDGEDAPEERITLVSTTRQLVSSNGNDGDDRCADRVEERLHPPEPAISDISQ